MEDAPRTQSIPPPSRAGADDASKLLCPHEIDIARALILRDPVCHGIEELPEAKGKRARVAQYLASQRDRQSAAPSQPNLSEADSAIQEADGMDDGDAQDIDSTAPLFHHLAQGLALTTGSALGSTPPSTATCLAAFLVPNKAHLTAGARAWSKHAHRSQPLPDPPSPPCSPPRVPEVVEGTGGKEKSIPAADAKELKKLQKEKEMQMREKSDGWWGRPSGPVAVINERALALFWKVVGGATWRNLHWLPHGVLVYEVRVEEGYGMRWSQDQSTLSGDDGELKISELKEKEVGSGEDDRAGSVGEEREPVKPWIFRGFVEPMMENGHELGWRHPI